jgi:hypothetical protein
MTGQDVIARRSAHAAGGWTEGQQQRQRHMTAGVATSEAEE